MSEPSFWPRPSSSQNRLNSIIEQSAQRALPMDDLPPPNPAKPEPNRIRSTHQTSAVGGTVEAAAERALPRAPRRGALVLRPDHGHRYVARGVLCKRDDGISVGAADPHLRLSAICRAAS